MPPGGAPRDLRTTALYSKIIMVLDEIRTHALAADSTNSAGTWVCQKPSLCRQLSSRKNAYLEEFQEPVFCIFSGLDVMTGL
jgi:hypothetical protein